MGLSLKKLLNGASALPYSEELINSLERKCRSYLGDEISLMDDFIVALVKGEIPEDFKKEIFFYIKEEGFLENLTGDVYIRLIQYIVFCAILENEDELYQAIFASKLMNYMLAAKALKHNLPNQKYIKEIYQYHLSRYLKDVDETKMNIDSDLRSEVPDDDFDWTLLAEQKDEVRSIFKEAELYRVEQVLLSDDVQRIENPFIRVYVGFYAMFDKLSYYFYDVDVKKIIHLLVREQDKNRRKKLRKIVEDIQGEVSDRYDEYDETSILLSIIHGGNSIKWEDLSLSITEFAVYLYYEFLTEKIVGTLN